MSIFKDTLTPTIQKQLTVRGDAFITRGPTNIIYINGRAAWIRLTSGVDVEGSGNDFARKNVLQGGTLNNFGKIDIEFGGGSSIQQYDLRAGVGSNYRTNAYSNNTNGPLGTKPNLYGLRPMPGITGLEISSLSAYGSVRQATITFNCWDIKQLELMEILYMRPGFLALVEWGWLPYLDNDGKLKTTFDSYSDTFLAPSTQSLQEHLISLYNQSVTHHGNVEGMLGYIKNYEWSSRPDGGYDCRTEIISTGEIMESLKVNYSYNYDNSGFGILTKGNGIIGDIQMNPSYYPAIADLYQRNVIAGLMSELIFTAYSAKGVGNLENGSTQTKFGVKSFLKQIPDDGYVGTITGYPNHKIDLVLWKVTGTSSNAIKPTKVGVQNDAQVYIDLDSLTKILSKNVIIANKDLNEKKSPLVEISTKERTFEKTDKNPKDLLCLAHPLQISVDPTICLIKNPYYSLLKNLSFEAPEIPQTILPQPTPIKLLEAKNVINELVTNPSRGLNKILFDYYGRETNIENIKLYSQYLSEAFDDYRFKYSINDTEDKLVDADIDAIRKGKMDKVEGFWAKAKVYLQFNSDNAESSVQVLTKIEKYILVNPINRVLKESTKPDDIINYSFKQFIDDNFGGGVLFKFTTDTNPTLASTRYNTLISSNEIIQQSRKIIRDQWNTPIANQELKDVATASSTFGFLDEDYKDYFTPTSNGQFGNISNIYINLNYVLNLSLDSGLESIDANEKREIHVYDFLKKLMYGVQSSIGSLNNFDIHVDPNDGVARIIDINYIDQIKPQEAYDNAYTFLSNTPTGPNAKLDGLYNNIRSYKIRSQIFKNQTSIVAISAQNGGGQLGLDNETLVGFNRGIKNRILPDINPPSTTLSYNNINDINSLVSNLAKSLKTILQFMQDLNWIFSDKYSYDVQLLGDNSKTAEYNQEYSEKYKGALRDLIASFKAISKSDANFKSIIPTTVSLELDGIGGLIIGHMFRLPNDLLPEGYKSTPSDTNKNKLGRRLGYIITKLGHKVTNNDWTTQIDAQTIILEEEDASKINFLNDMFKLAKEGVEVTLDPEGNIKTIDKVKVAAVNPPSELIIAMKKYGITSPLEIAHFLSQIAHESQGFRKTTEEASGEAYEGRVEQLGNTQKGDGKKYKGRGYIQLTGRGNYTSYNKYLLKKGIKDDILNNPNLVATKFAADSACWFWKFAKTNLPKEALKGATPDVVKEVTKIINGGDTGIIDRQRRFISYWAELQQNPKSYTT